MIRLGMRNDVNVIYSGMDVLLLPSLFNVKNKTPPTMTHIITIIIPIISIEIKSWDQQSFINTVINKISWTTF